MQFDVVIPGEPVGKGRPRFGGGTVFTPAKTVNYSNLVKTMAYMKYNGNVPMLQGPLKMEITAYLTIPFSATPKTKEAMRSGAIRPTKKPDVDNIAKICGDALNEVWYHDDSYIVDEHVTKWFADEPRVVIVVSELEG